MKHIHSFDLFEGHKYKDTKQQHSKDSWKGGDKKVEDFRKDTKDLIKSKGLTTKQVGSDLEMTHKGEMVAQIMFRDDYVGVKEVGVKFTDKFKYSEWGKIKSAISKIANKIEL
jgi:hypothetical protein